MKEITIKIHEIKTDGPPPNSESMTGRVAFIFDGSVVSGWPLAGEDDDHGKIWEADSDVGRHGAFANVTHWIEFPKPVWDYEK